jgi:hypothetical protein
MRRTRVTPVIDRRYPFEEIPEAIRYLEEGHAPGKVVITVWGPVLMVRPFKYLWVKGNKTPRKVLNTRGIGWHVAEKEHG